MNIKNHITALLVVAICGAFGFVGTVLILLWGVERASETSGNATEDLVRVQRLLSNSEDWLALRESIESAPPAVNKVIERKLDG